MMNVRLKYMAAFEKWVGIDEIIKTLDKNTIDQKMKNIQKSVGGGWKPSKNTLKKYFKERQSVGLYTTEEEKAKYLKEILIIFCAYDRIIGNVNCRTYSFFKHVFLEFKKLSNVKGLDLIRPQIVDKDQFIEYWIQMLDNDVVDMNYKEAAIFIERNFDTGYSVHTIRAKISPESRRIKEYED